MRVDEVKNKVKIQIRFPISSEEFGLLLKLFLLPSRNLLAMAAAITAMG